MEGLMIFSFLLQITIALAPMVFQWFANIETSPWRVFGWQGRGKVHLLSKRRQESLKRKTGMESNQKPVEKNDAFKCDQCEVTFKTRNGLKIHTGKTHEKASGSPEKLRKSSPDHPLNVSPSKETTRIVPWTTVVRNCLWHTSAWKKGSVLRMNMGLEAKKVDAGLEVEDVVSDSEGDEEHKVRSSRQLWMQNQKPCRCCHSGK